MPGSILTRDDYITFLQYLNRSPSTDEDFLIHSYFGMEDTYLKYAINRAYRDFNRTMHGFGGLAEKEQIRQAAKSLLESAFQDLAINNVHVTDAASFDSWHRSTCLELIAVYPHIDFHFYIGQAQKWINMTFKYIFTFGETRLPGYQGLYPYCHAPLDNILIAALMNYGFTPLPRPWSRLENYSDYLDRQNWLRQRFTLAPLDAEFFLWLGKEL